MTGKLPAGPQGNEGPPGQRGPTGPSDLYSDTGSFAIVNAGATSSDIWPASPWPPEAICVIV